MNSLTVCDETSDNVSEIIKNTDILFIVSDAVDNADGIIELAKLHQATAKSREATVLINMGNTDGISEVKDSFTTVISCDDVDKVYRIVEMLMIDMHNGYLASGMDYSDMNWLIKSSYPMRFREIRASNEQHIKKRLEDICKEIKKDYPCGNNVNVILYTVVPGILDLAEYLASIEDIINELINDIFAQLGFHHAEDGNEFLISMIYGAANTEIEREKREGFQFIDP